MTVALLLFLVGLLSLLGGFVNRDSTRRLEVATSRDITGRTTAITRAMAATRVVAVIWPTTLAMSLLVLKCVSKLHTSFQLFRYYLHASYACFVGLPYLREPLLLPSTLVLSKPSWAKAGTYH